jgi:bacitracin transport system ATP-binding protein
MDQLVIETRNLLKTYDEQTVVNNVSLHIEQGKIYGLLGRNGAGKTTIMKMILGLTSISSGEIYVFGQKLKGNEKRIYPRIGAIIDYPGFYPNLTGAENLKIFARLRGMTRRDSVKHAMEVVGLPYNDKKLFSKYSMGMKQRLGIANAIMHEPELLILDEPTNGLDPIGIAEVRKFIRNLCNEKGITILISSHILTEIEQLADTIGIINNGILLEESIYKDLQKKNKKYILLKVSSSSMAIRVLEQKFSISGYEAVDDSTLRIYELDLNMGEINKTLMMNNVEVISSQSCNDTLEDYFKRITGGEGIA